MSPETAAVIMDGVVMVALLAAVVAIAWMFKDRF